ncbi:MAG TPA: VOC family protein [Trueperaceae bacterium]|nr:VOC family protein [Trueperaceae bacterium]
MHESSLNEANALPAGTRPGAVTLRVRDLEAVARFYRDVLGLRVRSEIGPGDGPAVALGTSARTLVRLEPGARQLADRAAPGLYHLALLLPDRPALGAWLRHAAQAGTPLQGAADHGVSEAVYLADPEGNGVEVYRDRPRAGWEVDGDGVRMVTEPLDAAAVLASAAGAWSGAPAGTVMGHVHLQVADLGRARDFYQRALGFPVTNDRFPGACFLGAGGYHHHLGLNTWGTRPGAARSEGAAGLAALELRLPTLEDVAATASRLRATGWQGRREDRTLVTQDADGVEVRVRAADDEG